MWQSEENEMMKEEYGDEGKLKGFFRKIAGNKNDFVYRYMYSRQFKFLIFLLKRYIDEIAERQVVLKFIRLDMA